jgi:hypothetical protein
MAAADWASEDLRAAFPSGAESAAPAASPRRRVIARLQDAAQVPSLILALRSPQFPLVIIERIFLSCRRRRRRSQRAATARRGESHPKLLRSAAARELEPRRRRPLAPGSVCPPASHPTPHGPASRTKGPPQVREGGGRAAPCGARRELPRARARRRRLAAGLRAARERAPRGCRRRARGQRVRQRRPSRAATRPRCAGSRVDGEVT